MPCPERSRTSAQSLTELLESFASLSERSADADALDENGSASYRAWSSLPISCQSVPRRAHLAVSRNDTLKYMYEDFHVTDRWSGEDLHCRWKGTIVAIATRHADAVDIRFDVNGRPMWIALPCTAWVEQKKRTGKVITDQLAAQIAGRYLKQLIEEGYDSRREIYTMTVAEVLDHLDAVVAEAKNAGRNAGAAGRRRRSLPRDATRFPSAQMHVVEFP